MVSFLYIFEIIMGCTLFILVTNLASSFLKKVRQKRAPSAQLLSKTVWSLLVQKEQINPFIKNKLPLSSWLIKGSNNQLILIDGSSWDKEPPFSYWSVLEDLRKVANADEAWAMPIYRLTPLTQILVADNSPDGVNCQQPLRSKCWSGDLALDWVSFAKKEPELWKQTRYSGLELSWVECIFLEVAAPNWSIHSKEYDMETVLWFAEKTKPFENMTYQSFIDLGWCTQDEILDLQRKILHTIENSKQLKNSRWLNYEMISRGEKLNLTKDCPLPKDEVDPRFLSAL